MASADRTGEDFRRVLRSAERFSDRAICFGLRAKTRFSRSSAWLCSVTRRDHRRALAGAPPLREARARAARLGRAPVAFSAMLPAFYNFPLARCAARRSGIPTVLSQGSGHRA